MLGVVAVTGDMFGAAGAERRNNNGYARAGDAGRSDDVGTRALIRFGLPLALPDFIIDNSSSSRSGAFAAW